MKKVDTIEMRSISAGDSVFKFGDGQYGIFDDKFTFGFDSTGSSKKIFLKLLLSGKGFCFCFNDGGLYYEEDNTILGEPLLITPLGFINRVIQLIF